MNVKIIITIITKIMSIKLHLSILCNCYRKKAEENKKINEFRGKKSKAGANR
jgi:hypothetical protein